MSTAFTINANSSGMALRQDSILSDAPLVLSIYTGNATLIQSTNFAYTSGDDPEKKLGDIQLSLVANFSLTNAQPNKIHFVASGDAKIIEAIGGDNTSVARVDNLDVITSIRNARDNKLSLSTPEAQLSVLQNADKNPTNAKEVLEHTRIVEYLAATDVVQASKALDTAKKVGAHLTGDQIKGILGMTQGILAQDLGGDTPTTNDLSHTAKKALFSTILNHMSRLPGEEKESTVKAFNDTLSSIDKLDVESHKKEYKMLADLVKTIIPEVKVERLQGLTRSGSLLARSASVIKESFKKPSWVGKISSEEPLTSTPQR